MRNCQWRCQKQNVTAFVFRMNWRFDELRISHKTLRALEMLRCLHLWSLSNLLHIVSVLREPSTLRCCLALTIPGNFLWRLENLSSKVWTALAESYKSFTHIEHRAGAVGREGLVPQIPVLTSEYLLPSQWVPGPLLLIYYSERTDS